jgi:hypothetical protein
VSKPAIRESEFHQLGGVLILGCRYGKMAITVLTYSASTPVRMVNRFLVDFCQAGEPDDVLLQNEIAFCNRRTQLRSSPNNLSSHVG